MIPPEGDNDQIASVLDAFGAVCADSWVSTDTERNFPLRDACRRGVELMGPDAAWSLVGEADRIRWDYSTAVYHSTLLRWLARRSAHGKVNDPFSELTWPQRVLLMTIRVESGLEFDHSGAQILDHLTAEFGLVKTSARSFDRECEFTADDAARASRLAYALSQAVPRHDIAPLVLMYSVGLHTLVELVQANPDIVEYPTQWVVASSLPKLIEAKLSHENLRGDFQGSTSEYHIREWLSAAQEFVG